MSQNPEKPTSRGLRQQQRAAPAPAESRTPLLLGLGGLLLLVILGAIYFATRSGGPIADLENFPGQLRDHTEAPVNYTQNPPVGGVHSGAWLNCGIYDAPVPNENAVHSMEHGAVWITYDSTLGEDEVQTLRDLVSNRPYTLLSPYEALPAPVVASAWGLQIQATSVDDPRLAQFVSDYANGPQTPEKGARCDGGVGSPIQ